MTGHQPAATPRIYAIVVDLDNPSMRHTPAGTVAVYVDDQPVASAWCPWTTFQQFLARELEQGRRP